MASRNELIIPTKILTRLLAAVAGLVIVPLMLALFVLSIAIAVVVMPIATVWWIITGDGIVAVSREGKADDN